MQITLNHYDEEGNAVDTDLVEIDDEAVEDVIDRAAEVILAKRDGNSGKLEEALKCLESVLSETGII